MTAVILPADARRMASIMMSSSMRLSFTRLQVDWIINTSLPLTGSYTEIEHSPSANCVTAALPIWRKSWAHISSASPGFELPQKTFSSLPCEIIIFSLVKQCFVFSAGSLLQCIDLHLTLYHKRQLNRSGTALKQIKKLIYNHMEFVYNILAVYGPRSTKRNRIDAGI